MARSRSKRRAPRRRLQARRSDESSLVARIALASGVTALLLGGYLIARREQSIAARRRGYEQQIVDRLENERELERRRLGYPPRADR